MKLTHPLKSFILTQGFSENANDSYEKAGLAGHGAYDYGVPHGTPVYAALDADVYSLMNKDHSDPMKYRAVFQIFDDTDFSYEVSYGHFDSIFAKVGPVKRGDLLGTVGNTGTVYSGGVFVTREEKENGSTAGSHLHFQVRKCKRVKSTKKGMKYLSDANGKLFRNGFYYEVVDYDNGFNGCVDPAPFFAAKETFDKDLKASQMYNHDVARLQSLLSSEGFLEALDPENIGFYGAKTAKAVYAFQKKHVTLTLGDHLLRGKTVGPKTRKALNALL